MTKDKAELLLYGFGGKMGCSIRSLIPYLEFQAIHDAKQFHFPTFDGHNRYFLMDFSSPKTFDEVLSFSKNHALPIVMGTTGLNEPQMQRLKEHAQKSAVVYSSNFSIGMTVLCEWVGSFVKALPGFDVSILEQHHRWKKDKPSGTAKMLLSNILESGGNISTDESSVHSIRAGGIRGEHTVLLASDDEVIRLSHQILDRKALASGALIAARWLYQKNPSQGFFSMREILEL